MYRVVAHTDLYNAKRHCGVNPNTGIKVLTDSISTLKEANDIVMKLACQYANKQFANWGMVVINSKKSNDICDVECAGTDAYGCRHFFYDIYSIYCEEYEENVVYALCSNLLEKPIAVSNDKTELLQAMAEMNRLVTDGEFRIEELKE